MRKLLLILAVAVIFLGPLLITGCRTRSRRGTPPPRRVEEPITAENADRTETRELPLKVTRKREYTEPTE